MPTQNTIQPLAPLDPEPQQADIKAEPMSVIDGNNHGYSSASDNGTATAPPAKQSKLTNSFISPMCLSNEQIKQEPIGELSSVFYGPCPFPLVVLCCCF